MKKSHGKKFTGIVSLDEFSKGHTLETLTRM